MAFAARALSRTLRSICLVVAMIKRHSIRLVIAAGIVVALSCGPPIVLSKTAHRHAQLNLTGAWHYEPPGFGDYGRAEIVQRGNSLTIKGTWTPDPEPPPHYLVTATLSGFSIDGTWRCLVNACGHDGGRWHATVNAAGDRMVVSNSDDHSGNNINGVILRRQKEEKHGGGEIPD